MSTHNLVKSLRADRSQLASEVRQLRAEVERAKRALLAHGFTDCGGAEWKPPLGPHPGTLLAEVERLRALDKEAKSAFAPWVQGPGVVGGILHLQEEVERLRAEANARAVEELTKLESRILLDKCVTDGDGPEDLPHYKRVYNAACENHANMVNGRIAEMSKPAAKESEPSRCAERVWASGDMEACDKPLPCSDHTKPKEEPDWTVTLAAQANVASVRADKARLLTLIVEGLCNLGREVRRGGKS